MQKPSTNLITAQPLTLLTRELKDLIVAQSKAGCDQAAILASMLASGWREAAATQALEQTLREHSLENPDGGQQPVDEVPQPTATVASAPLKVPEPLTLEGTYVVQVADREVQVLSQMLMPRVVVFGGLLSHEECDELVELSRNRLGRSEAMQTDTGGTQVIEGRTSDGMFFRRGENPLCARIEARIAALLKWPLCNGEGMQVLRYQVGAQYGPHYDYIELHQPGTAINLKRGGQRVATLLMYLNTPARGGATTFNDAQMEVAPIKGNAVFFSYDRPDPATKTLHAGAPVLEGEKWVATKWLRESEWYY